MSIDRCAVIFAYNRPYEFELAFGAVIEYWLGDIIIFIDGPKNENDRLKQAEIIDKIPHDHPRIEVYERKTNYGLARSIISGLSFAFERYEYLVVIEDDCIITNDFVEFCIWADENYRHATNIGSVSGLNFLPCSLTNKAAYISKYHHCWGWATWRRAWSIFDYEMLGDHKNVIAKMSERFEIGFQRYWENIFSKTQKNEINSWAYRWLYSCWKNGFYSVTSRNCLVKNIGFGEAATHTKKNTIRNFTCFKPIFVGSRQAKRNKFYELITSMWHYATFLAR